MTFTDEELATLRAALEVLSRKVADVQEQRAFNALVDRVLARWKRPFVSPGAWRFQDDLRRSAVMATIVQLRNVESLAGSCPLPDEEQVLRALGALP